MPNPMKKFFKRPTVRRCRKVASKTFRKVFPEKGFYDIAQYRERGGLPEWLSKQFQREEIEWKHGLQPKPYAGRRHSLEMQPGRASGRGYQSFQGYFPCGSYPEVQSPNYDQTVSMSNISECMTDDSRHSAPGGAMYPTFQPQSRSTPDRLPAGGSGGNDTSAHRELMFMMDQLEQAELEKIQKDLRQFQTSRRRLMFNLSSLSATSSPPARFMKPATRGSKSPGCAVMPY